MSANAFADPPPCEFSTEPAANEAPETPVSSGPLLTLEDGQALADEFTDWVKRLASLTSTSDKIVGGRRACRGDWPYLAALRQAETPSVGYFCGGAAISSEWVLTAAHCVQNILPLAQGGWAMPGAGPLQVTLGGTDLGTEQDMSVFLATDVKIHPNYTPYNTMTGEPEQNDIALIKLNRPWTGPVAKLSAHVSTDADQASGRAFTAGYGLTSDPGGGVQGELRTRFSRRADGRSILAGSQYLLQTMLPLVNPAVCAASSGPYNPASKVCAGFTHGGRDSCLGDSGGPLVTLSARGMPYLIGVVSYGWGCAIAGNYGVYTRVSAHRDWIRSLVPDAEFILDAPESDLQRLSAVYNGLKQRLSGSDVDMGFKLLTGPDFVEGQLLEFEVRSDRTGDLLIIDISAAGKVTQLFPNPYMAPQQSSVIEAGGVVRVPSPDHGRFQMPASADPPGEGRLVAFLIPNNVPLPDLLRPKADDGLTTKADSSAYIMELMDLIDQHALEDPSGPNPMVRPGWGITSATYTIRK